MHFLSHARCNGKPPRQLAGISYFNRNTLLAAMMRNRETVRYLVAPTGFGKSLLACSYADLVNGLNGTVWIDCLNPCFLRDLDAHTLLPELLATTSPGELVVLDDLPSLAPARSEFVYELCSALVGSMREVVVCTTPSADPLGSHRDAFLCIEPSNFLYDERDMDIVRELAIANYTDMPENALVSHVPALALGGKESFERFLTNHINDVEDPFQTALTFSMLLLERGTFDDLEAIVGREVAFDDLQTSQLRPFVTADEFSREFTAFGFPFRETLRAFTPVMGSIAHVAGVEATSDFAMQVASVFGERNRLDRSVEVLVSFCDPIGRSRWLEDNQDFMLDQCALAAAERLFSSLHGQKWRTKPVLQTASCVRHALFALEEDAVDNLIAVANKVDFPLAQRLEAASYAYMFSEDAGVCHDLETALRAQAKSLKREADRLDEAHTCLWDFWTANVCENAECGLGSSKPAGGRMGPLALACHLHRMRVSGVEAESPHIMEAHVREMLAVRHDASEGQAALVILRREAEAYGLLDGTEAETDNGTLAAALETCNRYEDELEVQRSSYARSKAAYASAVATSLAAEAAMKNRSIRSLEIPTLNVRLFGRFEIDLDGAPINDKEFKRHKLRTLLSLLVLELGRDLSCDNLAERLWPDSSASAARHNFYNIISILRRGLSLADGSCPYLHRPHGTVRLSSELVNSDVERLDAVCRRLRFDDPEPDACLFLLDQVKELYRGELLPYEMSEPMILASREEWRNRLVNALMQAARRVMAIGDSAVALQLARQALNYDPSREDCYEQLMSMQARCGQRPAAIETWMRYRSYVNEELGLDPSPSVSSLYERIITD